MSGLIPTTTQQSHAGRHVCPHECLQPREAIEKTREHLDTRQSLTWSTNVSPRTPPPDGAASDLDFDVVATR